MKDFPKTQKTVLKNGLKIVTEKIPTMRSVATGILVGAGSGWEEEKESGISHFIEHMNFKGTLLRSAFQIAAEVDAIGGRINAFTSKEYTCFFTVTLDKYIDIGIVLLSDILLNSLYDPQQIELEKGVVLEEIKMYEDTPDELIHDFFAETILQGNPLARPVLGTETSVKAFNRDAIINYRERLYVPSNITVAVAGDIPSHTAIVRKIKTTFGKLKKKTIKKEEIAPQVKSAIKIKSKKTEQVHLCLGTKGVSQLDEDRYAYIALDNVLGGSMSSRLFQQIREKRGLAYSIYSTTSTFKNFGISYIYAGTSQENLKEVIDLTLAEFSKIKKEGISLVELERSKENIKGSLVLGLESTGSRMNWSARSEFYYGRVLTLNEIFEKVDNVTQDDIIRIANHYFLDKYLTLAIIGDLKESQIK